MKTCPLLLLLSTGIPDGWMKIVRKIIHVDMDAFYASVEQRDNPELKDKPVIVGGDPGKRGVVAACSYEARKFGIHSAMASSRAVRLCPQVVIIHPRFHVYQKVSLQIRAIFHEYTDLVEPLSLDEAYLDVTTNKKGITIATTIAEEIRQKIYEKTDLTASAGVSFNKFLAKVASAVNKPNGLTVITPAKADQFINNLPIGKFHGIGKVTEEKMRKKGIETGSDLKKISLPKMRRLYGKAGEYYYKISHGEDDRPVRSEWIRKSLGQETTFETDIDDRQVMLDTLSRLAGNVSSSLKKRTLSGRTVTLKVRYADFSLITRRTTGITLLQTRDEIMAHIPALLDRTEAGNKKVRLLGVTVSGFAEEEEKPPEYTQLTLEF
jgi:DNA polymerase-4